MTKGSEAYTESSPSYPTKGDQWMETWARSGFFDYGSIKRDKYEDLREHVLHELQHKLKHVVRTVEGAIFWVRMAMETELETTYQYRDRNGKEVIVNFDPAEELDYLQKLIEDAQGGKIPTVAQVHSFYYKDGFIADLTRIRDESAQSAAQEAPARGGFKGKIKGLFGGR